MACLTFNYKVDREVLKESKFYNDWVSMRNLFLLKILTTSIVWLLALGLFAPIGVKGVVLNCLEGQYD